MLLTLKKMRDQDKQLGILLKKLRTHLGYSLEDWAQIFDIDPVIAASIEAGYEIPKDFLITLVKWFINDLEHPQKSTEVLPDGWQNNLPDAIQTLLDLVEEKEALIKDLQHSHEIQKKTIDQSELHTQGHHRQIENYLKIVSKQQEKITALEKLQSIKDKTSKNLFLKPLLVGIVLLLIGGALFHFTNYQLSKQTTLVALAVKAPTLSKQLPYKVKLKQANKSFTPRKTYTKSYSKKITPKKTLSLGKPLLAEKPQSLKRINQGLSDLMATNNTRQSHTPEKFISTKGQLILKFNNPHQQKITIVVNNAQQRKVRETTTKATHYLLDTDQLPQGKYYYWVYVFPEITYQGSGSFVVSGNK